MLRELSAHGESVSGQLFLAAVAVVNHATPAARRGSLYSNGCYRTGLARLFTIQSSSCYRSRSFLRCGRPRAASKCSSRSAHDRPPATASDITGSAKTFSDPAATSYGSDDPDTGCAAAALGRVDQYMSCPSPLFKGLGDHRLDLLVGDVPRRPGRTRASERSLLTCSPGIAGSGPAIDFVILVCGTRC